MLNSPELPKATNAEERKRNIEVASKQTSLYNNPCLNEQKLSYKCLENNNYDKDICAVAFANYKACHEFWNKVTLDRRRKGIRPYLPRVEEREQIKAEYMEQLHGSSKSRVK